MTELTNVGQSGSPKPPRERGRDEWVAERLRIADRRYEINRKRVVYDPTLDCPVCCKRRCEGHL